MALSANELERLIEKSSRLQTRVDDLMVDLSSKDNEIERLQKELHQYNEKRGASQSPPPLEEAEQDNDMAARFALQAPPSAPRLMSSTFRVATSAPTVPIYNDESPAYASANIAGGMKLKNYKTGEDVEIFLDKFTNFCTGTSVPPNRQASVLLNAFDDTTFRVVSEELNESEKTNISTLKAYMKRRFEPARGPGQLRLLFRQSK